MRKTIFSTLLLVALAAPARAVLTDQEPSNDSVMTAAIQMTEGPLISSDSGILVFTSGGGDIDYIGIGGLVAGDVVTMSTTPLGDPPDFESPDTIVGLFDSSGTMLCMFDDAYNNQLDAFLMGYGSLCRLEIPVDGDYFVGVTGYSESAFDGSHGEQGSYALTVTIVPLPEPAAALQLASGALGLAVLHASRRRAKR